MVKGSVRHPAAPFEPPSPQGRDWDGLGVICGENGGSGDEDREGIGVWLRQRLRKGEKGISCFVLLCSFPPPPSVPESVK